MKSKKSIKVGGLKTPIYLACSNDHLRPVLGYVFFENGKVIATDAHILVIQDLRNIHELTDEEIENLNGKLIHGEVLKQLEKATIVRFEKDCIKATFIFGRSEHVMSIEYKTQEQVNKYPNYKAIMLSKKDVTAITTIGFNPQLLQRLTRAMKVGYAGIKMEFYQENKHIKVYAIGENEDFQEGILMPVALNS